MLDSIALSVERLKESRARIKSNEEMIQERYRSNLLRAISHVKLSEVLLITFHEEHQSLKF